jgi:Domain of unknown function (DUF4268)
MSEQAQLQIASARGKQNDPAISGKHSSSSGGTIQQRLDRPIQRPWLPFAGNYANIAARHIDSDRGSGTIRGPRPGTPCYTTAAGFHREKYNVSLDCTLIEALEIVPLRDAFKKEATHFTTWLESHIDALSSRIGIPLTVIRREQTVGDFNVDLLCQDEGEHPVIIENQLERTDHNHLGQLLTYLVNLDAKAAIWITADPRAEHQRVITWLNEVTPEDVAFYLVRVEAIRIGSSPFAPLFTVLAGPDRQVKDIGKVKKEWADRHLRCAEFWKSLLGKSKDRTQLFSNISPSRYNFIGTGAGKSGLSFTFTIRMDSGIVELYIDHDQDTGRGNKAIFDALHSQKASVERDFGGALEWERLDDKRASRIKYEFRDGGLATPATWPHLQDQMIDAMIRLEKAMRPRLKKPLVTPPSVNSVVNPSPEINEDR